MNRWRMKKGDSVMVSCGDYKGVVGEIMRICRETDRIVVSGVNYVKAHKKPSQANPNGGIVEFEAPIHKSNVRFVDSSGKMSKIGIKFDKDNKKVRFFKSSGDKLESENDKK